jgi:hypothetical protein
MRNTTIIGLNGLGDVVLFCKVCSETFARRVQEMNLGEINNLDAQHKCGKVPVGASA